MKPLLFFSLMLTAVLAFAGGEPSFLKKGDLIEIIPPQTMSGPVTVTELGANGWVQIEELRPVRGKDGAVQHEKVKIWVNFAHVQTCKVLAAP